MMIGFDILKLVPLWIGVFLVVILLSKSSKKLFKRFPAARTYGKIFSQLTIVVLVFTGVTLSLGMLGLGEAVTSTLTFSAILALGVSLAVRGLITNIIAGVELAVSQEFCVGDRVEIAGNRGEVIDMGLSKTKIKTGKETVIIPNSRITGVYGWTIVEKARVEGTERAKNLSNITKHHGYGVVEVRVDPKEVGIIAKATTLIANEGIGIRQIDIDDAELSQDPKLMIVTEKEIPSRLVPKLTEIRGVKRITVY